MSEQASPATAAPVKAPPPKLHPTAIAVRDQPLFSVEQLTVAGDPDSLNGKVFAATGADDLRQGIPWNSDHEGILSGLLARGNTRLCLHPSEKGVRCRTQTGEAISLYVQALPGGSAQAARDDLRIDGTCYAAVIEGGRQRRRCAETAGQRLKWIADTFGAPLRTGKPQGRMVKFRNAILGWLASAEGKDSEESAWLSEPLVLDLIGNPDEEYSGWFTPDLQPIPFLLTASVFGVNVNLADPEVMARSIARNEGKVKTPPSMRAAQIQRLRSKLKPDGSPLLTFDRIGVLLLGSAGGGDTIRDYSLVSDLNPEVRALLDSGQLSLKVAIKGNSGRRDQAFVNHPKGGERAVLTPKQQGYVLRCLVEEFTDAEGKLKDISGDRAFRVALKAKEQALAGASLTLKQLAELEGDDGKSVEEEQAEKAKGKPEKAPQTAQEPAQTAPATTTQPGAQKAASEPQGAAPQVGRPASGSAPQVQVAQPAPTPAQTTAPATGRPVSGSAALKPPTLTRWTDAQVLAWAERADELAQTLPDPSVSGLTQSEIDRRSQAQAEALIGGAVLAYFAGRAGALRDFPVLRQILDDVSVSADETTDEEPGASESPAEASLPAESPPAQQVRMEPVQRRVSAEEFQRALMTTAIDAWVDSGHAAPAPVIDPAATIAGLVPTADEVTQAQETLKGLIEKYEATDKSEELEAFLLNTIYAA